MFLVFNKQKIYAYLIVFVTVISLFFMAGTKTEDTLETSAKQEKLLPIYNVETKEKKVALTMNCAWNADDIDKILNILKENNVKITFFIVGDWIDKYP